MAKRQRYLFTCVNRRPDGSPHGSCAARGSEEIARVLKARLKEEGLAEVVARSCTSSCQDICWVGPTILLEPHHVAYGRVTPR